MEISKTKIEGVVAYNTTSFEDERGSFTRLFSSKCLADALDNQQIAQINQSVNHYAGTIRGLHYQHPPHTEMKIVRVLSGKIYDIAVDIRKNSKTFLQWVGVELSAENQLALIIPKGCAHGFQTLEDNTTVIYLTTNYYQPTAEGIINYADPAINISWPLTPTKLSPKDKNQIMLPTDFNGINFDLNLVD